LRIKGTFGFIDASIVVILAKKGQLDKFVYLLVKSKVAHSSLGHGWAFAHFTFAHFTFAHFNSTLYSKLF
jgi:hypothetical protein